MGGAVNAQELATFRTPELDASLQGLRRQVASFTGLHVEILTV
jgi:hypothetical protein